MKNILLLFILIMSISCYNRTKEKSTSSYSSNILKAEEYRVKASGNQHAENYRLYIDSALMFHQDANKLQVYSYSYKKTGEHLKAMELLNKAVALDPKEILGYRAWSLLYYYRDYEKTIKDVDALLQISGQCLEVCWGESCKYLKFLALYRLNQYDHALTEMESIIKCDTDYGFDPSDNDNYTFYSGRCYQLKGEYEKAIEYYDKLITDNGPVSAEYLYYKGIALISLKRKKDAIYALKKALEAIKKSYKFSDPYIELFDEIYPWMIQKTISELEIQNPKFRK